MIHTPPNTRQATTTVRTANAAASPVYDGYSVRRTRLLS